jgi:hypothetical protein
MIETNKEIFARKWFVDKKSEIERIEFIDSEIKNIKNQFPSLQKYLSRPKIPIKFIYLLAKLRPIDEMMLFDVVWANVEILYKESGTEDNLNKKLQPIFDIFLEFIKTDYYADFLIDNEVTGDEYLKFGYKTIPISKQAIKLHISRLKAVPIIAKEIREIQDDWEDFIEKRYENRINKKVGTTDSTLNNQKSEENPYPRIFVNYKSWQLFEHWRDDVKERTQLAEFSFIFWQMQNDGLIYQEIKPTEFRNWLLSSFEIELDELKQLRICDGGNKYSRYQTAKLLFKC